jgi:hypothetical protein
MRRLAFGRASLNRDSVFDRRARCVPGHPVGSGTTANGCSGRLVFEKANPAHRVVLAELLYIRNEFLKPDRDKYHLVQIFRLIYLAVVYLCVISSRQGQNDEVKKTDTTDLNEDANQMSPWPNLVSPPIPHNAEEGSIDLGAKAVRTNGSLSTLHTTLSVDPPLLVKQPWSPPLASSFGPLRWCCWRRNSWCRPKHASRRRGTPRSSRPSTTT